MELGSFLRSAQNLGSQNYNSTPQYYRLEGYTEILSFNNHEKLWKEQYKNTIIFLPTKVISVAIGKRLSSSSNAKIPTGF